MQEGICPVAKSVSATSIMGTSNNDDFVVGSSAAVA
jgi:hypothetical protein